MMISHLIVKSLLSSSSFPSSSVSIEPYKSRIIEPSQGANYHPSKSLSSLSSTPSSSVSLRELHGSAVKMYDGVG